MANTMPMRNCPMQSIFHLLSLGVALRGIRVLRCYFTLGSSGFALGPSGFMLGPPGFWDTSMLVTATQKSCVEGIGIGFILNVRINNIPDQNYSSTLGFSMRASIQVISAFLAFSWNNSPLGILCYKGFSRPRHLQGKGCKTDPWGKASSFPLFNLM